MQLNEFEEKHKDVLDKMSLLVKNKQQKEKQMYNFFMEVKDNVLEQIRLNQTQLQENENKTITAIADKETKSIILIFFMIQYCDNKLIL